MSSDCFPTAPQCSKRMATGRRCVAALNDSCWRASGRTTGWPRSRRSSIAVSNRTMRSCSRSHGAPATKASLTRGPSISLRSRASVTCPTRRPRRFRPARRGSGCIRCCRAPSGSSACWTWASRRRNCAARSTDADDLKREIERSVSCGRESIRRSCSSTITGAKRSRRARTACISGRKTCRPPT